MSRILPYGSRGDVKSDDSHPAYIYPCACVWLVYVPFDHEYWYLTLRHHAMPRSTPVVLSLPLASSLQRDSWADVGSVLYYSVLWNPWPLSHSVVDGIVSLEDLRRRRTEVADCI